MLIVDRVFGAVEIEYVPYRIVLLGIGTVATTVEKQPVVSASNEIGERNARWYS